MIGPGVDLLHDTHLLADPLGSGVLFLSDHAQAVGGAALAEQPSRHLAAIPAHRRGAQLLNVLLAFQSSIMLTSSFSLVTSRG